MFLVFSFLILSEPREDQVLKDEVEIEATSCHRSSDCFSYEHCNDKNQCVDVSASPCSSSGDCVAGESCDYNVNPHRCR